MNDSADDSGFWGLPESDEEWTEFVNLNGKKLYWFLLRKLGNHQDAEDCLQQTFEKFFKYIDNYDQSRSLLSYLYGIAEKVFFDFVKARKRDANLPFEPKDDPKFYELRKQLLTDFVKEQVDLNQDQCELFVMLVFHELSPKEIACILDITPKSARQRIWKLRKLLRDQLDRDDFLSSWH